MKLAWISVALLATAAAFAQQPPTAPSPTAPTTRPTSSPTSAPTTAPLSRAEQMQAAEDAENLLDRLLSAKPGTARPLEALSPEEANAEYMRRPGVEPSTPSTPLKREGDIISQRSGRLFKAADGRTEFHFESDRTTLGDPPMTIVPNQNLMRMEDANKKSGRDLRFRVTGSITRYRGENYLLIEKVDVQPDQEGL